MLDLVLLQNQWLQNKKLHNQKNIMGMLRFKDYIVAICLVLWLLRNSLLCGFMIFTLKIYFE